MALPIKEPISSQRQQLHAYRNITNSGALQLGSTANCGGTFTELSVGASGVTASTGGGTVTMSNFANNGIYWIAGIDVLTNANNTIQGSGFIGR